MGKQKPKKRKAGTKVDKKSENNRNFFGFGDREVDAIQQEESGLFGQLFGGKKKKR